MIWIDTDMGFDDILAIMMVDRSDLEIAGLSLVSGNAQISQVCRNAAGAQALFGWQFPIYPGAAKSILGDVITPEHVLGPTGIPTLGRTLPQGPAVDGPAAGQALAAWLENRPDTGDILALGPLTNLAILVLSRPDLLAKIGTLTWMGGGATSGNQTPSAEFNAYADPEALHIVLQSGINLRIVDLDLCRQVLLGPGDLDGLRRIGTQKSLILNDLARAYVDIAVSRGRPKMALYDPTAAASVVDPSLVGFEPCCVTMELTGVHTRGRTILERSRKAGSNCQWAMTVDASRVLDLAVETLEEVARL